MTVTDQLAKTLHQTPEQTRRVYARVLLEQLGLEEGGGNDFDLTTRVIINMSTTDVEDLDQRVGDAMETVIERMRSMGAVVTDSVDVEIEVRARINTADISG